MKKKALSLFLILTICLSASVFADEKDDRIKELERQVAVLEATIRDLKSRLAEYEPNLVREMDTEGITYILNTKSHKIHKIDGVDTDTIADENRQATDKTLEELLSMDYTTCGRCFK